MRHYLYGDSVSSVCTGSFFLYLENKITSSIGNPKMADNRKMVATCQGSTCRKTLTSAAEKNAYGSLAFSSERKELTHCRNFTGRSELLPQAVLHFGQRKALPPVERVRESRKPLVVR